jgi:hypothetical protein
LGLRARAKKLHAPHFFVTKLKANVGASKYSSIKNMDKHQSLTAVWVIARTVW